MKASCSLGFAFWLLAASALQAYPEFQAQIVKQSGRSVNCAVCHVHGDGPDGNAVGQIGHLTKEEFDRLGMARAALEPGANVNSPILNSFGNHIIHSIGKKSFLELRQFPQKLAEVLPANSDLDGDGIPDVREFLDGTHPLKKNDGAPLLLLKINIQRNLPQLGLTIAATLAGLFGLNHLLHGFAIALRSRKENSDDENESD